VATAPDLRRPVAEKMFAEDLAKLEGLVLERLLKRRPPVGLVWIECESFE
jgi:hypothetical protein